MQSYIFDTSFLISLISINDINHAQAVQMISGIAIGDTDNRFFISEAILAECYTVISYKLGFSTIQKLDTFLDEIGCQYLRGDHDDYFSLFRFFEGKISVADSSVISDAIKYSLQILAFDKGLLTLYKSI